MNAEYSRPTECGNCSSLRISMSLPASAPDRRRRPFADAVDGENRGFVERRRIERARRVRQVMLGIEDAVARAAQLAQMLGEQPPHEQLLLDPHRHRRRRSCAGRWARRRDRSRAAARTSGTACRRRRPRTARRTAMPASSRTKRQAWIGNDASWRRAREALLLRGRDDPAVDEQRRGAVVVDRRRCRESPFSCIRTACR